MFLSCIVCWLVCMSVGGTAKKLRGIIIPEIFRKRRPWDRNSWLDFRVIRLWDFGVVNIARHRIPSNAIVVFYHKVALLTCRSSALQVATSVMPSVGQ